jgi:hypothetical protein
MTRAFGTARAAPAGAPPTLIDALAAVLDPLLLIWPGRVFLDVRDLNPPCAFLHPPVLNYRTLADGRYSADQTLLLVASNTVRRESYEQLSRMLAEFRQALPGRGDVARPADIWTADGSAVLAGYELTWTDRFRGEH